MPHIRSRCLPVLLASTVGAMLLFQAASADAETKPQTQAPAGSVATTYEDPFAYCAAVGTVDEPDARYTGPKLPDSILRAVASEDPAAAGASAEFQDNAVWRCMDKKVWYCHFGANLPCQEKADLSKTPTEAMVDYCKENPAPDSIPIYVTGRATVYDWQCKDGKPEVGQQLLQADPQGFLTDFWYRIEPK